MIQNVVPLPAPAAREAPAGIVQIPVEKVVPNPRQPRSRFDDAEMASLVESIKAFGVVQPVIVRPAANGTYELVAGERRWRASIEADLWTVPAIVRQMGQTESLEIALIENIQRANLSSIETALAYKSLLEEHGMTHEEVAERVGKDRSTITNTLRLLKLPIDVQNLVSTGQIGEGHARAILSIQDEKAQIALAHEIVKKGLSVRAVEERVFGRKREAKAPERRPSTAHPEWRAAEEQLIRRWGRQVRIAGKKNGRVELAFHGLEDLTRLVRDLLR